MRQFTNSTLNGEDEMNAKPDLQNLIDRQMIADLFATYAKCLDDYDVDGLGQCFLEDGIMDQGPGRGGPVTGREKIVAGVKERHSEYRRTCHHLGQSLLAIDGDSATGTTYVIAWHQTWEGEIRTVYLRYQDKLSRIETGEWKIARRASQAMAVEGFS